MIPTSYRSVHITTGTDPVYTETEVITAWTKAAASAVIASARYGHHRERRVRTCVTVWVHEGHAFGDRCTPRCPTLVPEESVSWYGVTGGPVDVGVTR